VRPTPLASDLAESIRTALDAVEEARTRHSAALSGRVVIGAIRSLQPTMIPLVLREIGDRHPGLAVRVIQGDSGELLDHLKAGRLDGAALIRPTSGGSSRLDWQDLERQPFVFVAPPDSTQTTAEALIARYDWIQFDTSLTSGRTAASHLHRLSPGTRPRFELESIEAVLAMVSAGLGVSIIPRLPVAPTARAPVRQIPLGVSTPTRQIAFVCRSGDADNRRVRAIRDAVGPAVPVSIKLNSADFQRGGFDEGDSLQVMAWLEADGVDLIEISGGTYEAPAMTGARRSTVEREGYFLDFVAKARERLAVPLCITGGFRTLVDQQHRTERIPCIFNTYRTKINSNYIKSRFGATLENTT
jgi:DNA-binding transcriptional LysR family regulator